MIANSKETEPFIKVILLGGGAAGKTNILSRIV